MACARKLVGVVGVSLLFAGCATPPSDPGAMRKGERFAYPGGELTLRQAAGECRVVLAGEINPAMVSSLSLAMADVEKRTCGSKWLELNVTEGRLGPAVTVGSMLKNRGYNTRLQPGSICQTPCLLVFAAGVQRVIPRDLPLARVGFSQIPPDEDFGRNLCETELNNNQRLTLARYLRAVLPVTTANAMFLKISAASCREVNDLPISETMTMGLATGG